MRDDRDHLIDALDDARGSRDAALATIADLRAKLAEAERERDEARHRLGQLSGPEAIRLEMVGDAVDRAEAAEAEARALREAAEKVIAANDGPSGSLAEKVYALRPAIELLRLALRGKEADR